MRGLLASTDQECLPTPTRPRGRRPSLGRSASFAALDEAGILRATDPVTGKERMDNGRIAAAVIGGYLLGRTKKMKFAIMVGGALMGKKIPTDPTQLLKLAGTMVDKSPELQRLDTAVRGRLMDAGKDAALSVASTRMEAFTDSLVNRVENLGKPTAEPAAGSVPQDGEAGDADVEDGEFEDLESEDQVPAARNDSASRHGSAHEQRL